MIRACHCCGLAHRVPAIPRGMHAVCTRCGTSLLRAGDLQRSNGRTLALATAALVLYPFAVLLPMLRMEQLGHRSEASVLGGVAALLGDGQWFVGLVVLACSIVLPLAKLGALLALSSRLVPMAARHRATTYRLVELTGRWGMLDVLLVAILVAIVKLGGMASVAAGPAAAAFAGVVILSLLASASFDPHRLWEVPA